MSSSSRLGITDLKRRITSRLRGEVNVRRLVAQGLDLGRDVYIARSAYVDSGHPWLISIGDESVLGPWVIVLAHDASTRLPTGHTLVGRVSIGSRVFVGHRTIITPGSTIGDDAVIGVGSVVSGNVPPRSLAMGNPAEVVSSVGDFATKHREAIERGPRWPIQGWALPGITPQRRAEQRELLAGGCGYLRAPAALARLQGSRERTEESGDVTLAR